MNLNEEVSRIKDMMRINESSINIFKRRIDDLPNYVRATYKWLNPKAFNSIEEFMDRVDFATTRDFVSDIIPFQNPEEFDNIRSEVLPFVQQFIYDNFYEEIKDYFIKQQSFTYPH